MSKKASDWEAAQSRATQKRVGLSVYVPALTPIKGRGVLSERPPTWVDDADTRAAYGELRRLAPPGLWTQSDLPIVVQLATLHGALRRGGLLEDRELGRYDRLCDRLGLTPASRAKIKLRPDPKTFEATPETPPAAPTGTKYARLRSVK